MNGTHILAFFLGAFIVWGWALLKSTSRRGTAFQRSAMDLARDHMLEDFGHDGEERHAD